MAIILQFRRGDGPARPSMLSGIGQELSGEIIIFPGVRIERHTDEGRSRVGAPARKRAQRRKK